MKLHLRARQPEMQVQAMMTTPEPDDRNPLLYGQHALQVPRLPAKIDTVLD
jgi:hypothetical protein